MSTWAIARARAPPGSVTPSPTTPAVTFGRGRPPARLPAREAELGRDRAERADDDPDVRVEVDAELARSAIDVLAVHGPRERLVLELLLHRPDLQAGDDLAGTHEGHGVHEAGELIAGVQGAVQERHARDPGIIRVREDGVDDGLGHAARDQDLGTLRRMLRRVGMHLVIEVVE